MASNSLVVLSENRLACRPLTSPQKLSVGRYLNDPSTCYVVLVQCFVVAIYVTIAISNNSVAQKLPDPRVCSDVM